MKERGIFLKRFRKVLIVLLAILVPVSIGFGFNFFNKEINSTSNKQNKTMIVDGELTQEEADFRFWMVRDEILENMQV